MAGQDRAAAHALAERLEMKPYSFDFYQAVRRLECTHPHMPRIGSSVRPMDDPARFCQRPFLAFAPSAIQDFDRGDRLHAPEFVVNFFGLFGPNGPLPLHLTEYARDRQRNHNDPTLVKFLDVFHHRMVSLFYRAWACNQQTVSFDRPQEDRFSVYIGSLFGVGMESMRDRDAVSDLAKLYFSGHLACQTRHADGLCSILTDYFGVPVEIEEFRGRWIDLPEDCRCYLGKSESTGTLGSTTIAGAQIWDCQGNFRIKFGPLDIDAYTRLLPDTDSFQRLVAWVRHYLGDVLSWDVQLILKAGQVPALRLGSVGQLGWSTWLISEPVLQDADDLVVEPIVRGQG